ncbi:LytR cell envelope-related transcriptional attenuator [Amycolatopsis marina]|uniref:LytR cell envelope-related transcriptional attenuator n=1 Tax=Amycolatopsis marina TaxID=490629 RepID=A0A1I1CDR7_9PSEU|nr:LytR C-terminal domain-containing protein [Amycolatopsis marina]SFB60252.1 LytR cell envelope-related transcriptional attenuator [Amycolatopsis marina]
MSFGGVSRPARAAGIGLLAVAAAAAVIGGVTLLTNGDGDNTAAPPSTSAPGSPSDPGTSGPDGSSPPSSPGDTSTPPGTSGEPSDPADPTGQPEQSGQPGQPGQPQPGQPGGPPAPGADGSQQDRQASAKWVSVRVYNNSTTKGLASKAAEDLRGQGWNVGEVANYSSGIIPTTTAYYRPGTDEQTAADALAASFGMRSEPRFAGIKDSAPGVIVIVTNDYGQSNGKSGK